MYGQSWLGLVGFVWVRSGLVMGRCVRLRKDEEL